MEKMKANVFHGKNDIRVEEVERPRASTGEAIIRVTLTTICGTDLHILRGEYPVKPGLIIGHEPVGVIEELGAGVTGYAVGDRVLVGAITPCGQCRGCLSGQLSQCGHGEGYEALCATAGARLMGATLIIGIDGDDNRLAMAKRMGADVALDYREVDVVAEVQRLTGGGVDVAIEALGTQQTFESALRSLRPGGTLSSLGVYSGKLQIPYEAFAAGLGDQRIVTTLCPGGKERMRRLMEVVRAGRVDFTPLLTHTFALDRIGEAYQLFGEHLDGVLKVAIKP